jgi:hypothetical protein
MCRAHLIGRWLLVITAAFAFSMSSAEAGSGRYDKSTKSFSLTYIYLDLPSGVMDENQVLAAGQSRRPSTEEARNVQVFWGSVSDLLSKLTAGRAKIGNLQETKDIEKADVVISLTGSITSTGAGGAWAQSLGWNKPSATLNLYYQDLAKEKNADIVETVVHELCHYLIGLPDEYLNTSTAPQCPLDSPGGGRCLMDNYHIIWNGGFCTKGHHNSAAPLLGGRTSPLPDKVGLSCQEIVDQFFDNLGVSADPGAVNTAQPSGSQTPMPASLKETILGKARAEIAKIKAKRGNGLFSPEARSRIKGFVVNALVDAFRTAEGNPPQGIGGWAEKLTSTLLLSSVGVPPGLSLIEPFLRKEALRLGQQILDPQGKASAIQTGLLDSAMAELKRLGTSSPSLAPEDVEFISALSKQAAAGQDTTAADSPEKLQLEYQREMAETLLAIANKLDVPGAAGRRSNFDRIYSGLAIPDRPLGSRYGQRSTVVIEPPVLVGQLSTSGIDNAETQGYSSTKPESNYNLLRKASLFEFSKLVDRTRISVLTASSFEGNRKNPKTVKQGFVQAGPTAYDSDSSDSVFEFDRQTGLDALINDNLDPELVKVVLAGRRARIATSLALIQNQIERDQIENIVLLVPPRGLPDDFGDALVPLRAQFLGKTDLRLDIALVGSASIPPELRDLVSRTRGSILTVADFDEVGAVAQRLAGEQTQGTWVTIPQQGVLLLDGAKPDYADEKPGPSQPYSLFTRLRNNRSIHQVKTDAPSNVILKPFYVDPATSYELIVGLTQPLTIAGLTDDPWVLANPDPEARANAPWGGKIAISEANQKLFPFPELKLIAGPIEDPKEIQNKEGGAELPFANVSKPLLMLDKSTPTTLVFQFPAGSIPAGWYTPTLTLNKGNFSDLGAGGIPPTLIDDAKTKALAAANSQANADTSANAARAADDLAKANPSDKTKAADASAKKKTADTDATTAKNDALAASAAAAAKKPPLQAGGVHKYRNSAIHFTFSVGTPTSKAQLIAGLVQDAPKDTSSTDQGTTVGTLEKDGNAYAYVSAVLSAGAAVTYAKVSGFAQKIDSGIDDIPAVPVEFKDDGVAPDTQKDDGIYTGKIKLEKRRTKSAEYRVFVEGASVAGQTKFIPAAEAGLVTSATATPADPTAVKQAADRPAPAFQRATSIEFLILGNQ